LQPTERLEQTVLPVARNRSRLTLPLLFELAPRNPRPLAPPPTTLIPTEHQHWIYLHLSTGLLLADRPPPALHDPALGLLQGGAAALSCAQLLWQLIATRLSVELILATVDLLRLAQNLRDQPPVGAVLIHRRVGLD